jgi:2-polyprenyl-6-methoxyphenol hydroxylase-like FAD-dependent oxidoreductase
MRDDLMFDVVVVGAGPAGLAFTRSLAGAGLSVALIEGQDEAALRDPAFDGREIALTHNSIRLLKSLDVWDRVPAKRFRICARRGFWTAVRPSP